MMTLLPVAGLVGSNNLSTAVIILGIGVLLIFVANPRYLQFLALGGAGIGFIAVFLAAESYRLERLAIWRDPENMKRISDYTGPVCDRKRRNLRQGVRKQSAEAGICPGSPE